MFFHQFLESIKEVRTQTFNTQVHSNQLLK